MNDARVEWMRHTWDHVPGCERYVVRADVLRQVRVRGRFISGDPSFVPITLIFSNIDRCIGSGESRKPDKVGKPGRHRINGVQAIRDVGVSGGGLFFRQSSAPRSEAGGRGLRGRHGGEYARPPP